MDIKGLSIKKITQMLSEYTDEDKTGLIIAMKADTRQGIAGALKTYHKKLEREEKAKAHSLMMIAFESELWSNGYEFIAGIDEVGRGPLAGPVMAGCVILPRDLIIPGVDDSKKLSAKQREELYEIISDKAISCSTGRVEPTRIDIINILNATKAAMISALRQCDNRCDYLLIDAVYLPDVSMKQKNIIGGDGKSQSIAAASIIAKVTRDREMEAWAKRYPQYGFERNKGYGTKEHVEAIRKYGLCPIHRRSFTRGIT